MSDSASPAGSQPSSEKKTPSQLLFSECNFPGVTNHLTKLKVCINLEYHREAAIEGHQPAVAWLESEYPGLGLKPYNAVPPHVVKERIDRLEREQLLAAASQLLLSPEEIPFNEHELNAKAIETGRPLVALPVNITTEALAKVEGLTQEKYEELMARRGPRAMETARLVFDWSLRDETLVNAYRAMLKLFRPIPAIEQERGKSSTLTGLRLILNALVVYRLLGRGALSITKAVEAFEDANIPPPYSLKREQRWRDAQKKVRSVMLLPRDKVRGVRVIDLESLRP